MANPDHLAILKQGVDAWSAWRKRHEGTQPDLRGVVLRNAHFWGVDLQGANLNGAHLEGVDFRHAELRMADLRGVHLEGADLQDAHLDKADLAVAHLKGADLRRAHLECTHLAAADLTGADLTGAHLFSTVLGNTDLTRAIGLDCCHHSGPSIIDFATLQQSGPLPLPFLRGCGLPDELIRYLPSLLNQPVQFYACFISHSTRDKEFAERLHADLQDKGVRCWFAPENLKIGDPLRVRIDESIRVYDKLLLVLSEHSLASEWVGHEVEVALRKERESKYPVLFPIRLDQGIFAVKTGWANDVLTRHIGDFREWKHHDAYQKALERLLQDLSAEGGR